MRMSSIADRPRVTAQLMGKQMLEATGAALCRVVASAANSWTTARRIMVIIAWLTRAHARVFPEPCGLITPVAPVSAASHRQDVTSMVSGISAAAARNMYTTPALRRRATAMAGCCRDMNVAVESAVGLNPAALTMEAPVWVAETPAVLKGVRRLIFMAVMLRDKCVVYCLWIHRQIQNQAYAPGRWFAATSAAPRLIAKLAGRTRPDPATLRNRREALRNAAGRFILGRATIISGHCIVRTVMGRRVKPVQMAAVGCRQQAAHRNTARRTAAAARTGEEEWIYAVNIPPLSVAAALMRPIQ